MISSPLINAFVSQLLAQVTAGDPLSLEFAEWVGIHMEDSGDRGAASGHWLPRDVARAGLREASGRETTRPFADGLASLRSRQFFEPHAPWVFESDPIAIISVAIGIRHIGDRAAAHWLADIAGRAMKGESDPWRIGLLAAALALVWSEPTRPIPPDLAKVLTAKGVQIPEYSPMDQTLLACFALDEPSPERAAVRLAAIQTLTIETALAVRPSVTVTRSDVAGASDQKPNIFSKFAPIQEASLRADVLIVVVTDIERDAVFAASGLGVDPPQVNGPERTYHDLGLINGARVLVVQTEMGTATVGGSLTTIMTAITEVMPTTILMVGIAFGLDPDKQRIGQILVSRQIQLYGLQRIGTGQNGQVSILPRGDKVTATPTVLSRLRAASSAFRDADVKFELLLSGDKLVDNYDFREELRRLEPEAAGGEMEGGGLYVAVAEKRLSWCVVKAICDFADGHKQEQKVERQKIAANNAARFVISALKRGGFASRDH